MQFDNNAASQDAFNASVDNQSNPLYSVCGEITYPFQNFNGATVENWEWINNFTPHFPGHVITFP